VTPPPLVFVLMPFDASFTDVYDTLVKRPLEGIGFEVRRADSLFNQQQILKDVVKGIADATLVIADVTGLNENVLYELGLAHALGKRTVMITQALDELPFDLRPYRANEYSVLFSKAGDLSNTLVNVGQAVLDGSADFGNPVQDFAPYALGAPAQVAASTLPGQGVTTGVSDEETPGGGDDEEPPGLLERVVAMERGSEQAAAAMEEISSATTTIGEKMQANTGRLDRARASLGNRSSAALLTIARDTAGDLTKYAESIQPLTGRLSAALAEMTTGVNALAREGTLQDEDDARAVEELIETMRAAEDGMNEGRESTIGFAQTLLDLPNVDRTLTRAAKRTAGAVTSTAEELANGEAEFARARGLLLERLEAYQRDKSCYGSDP